MASIFRKVVSTQRKVSPSMSYKESVSKSAVRLTVLGYAGTAPRARASTPQLVRLGVSKIGLAALSLVMHEISRAP
jgi:hypothetical protein